MSHELNAKEWNLNTTKTAEAVILLDLVATLRAKARNKNQGRAEVHMENKIRQQGLRIILIKINRRK